MVKDDNSHNDFLRKLIHGNVTPLNNMDNKTLESKYEDFFNKEIFIQD